MTSSGTWKARERRLLALFGCKRRGADYGDRDGGKSDSDDACGYNIEIKSWAKPPSLRVIQKEVNHAETRGRPNQIPLAITCVKGERDLDALVTMRFETFLEWFVPPVKENKNGQSE